MDTNEQLRVGDVLVDNDPRMKGRRVTIEAVGPDSVAAKDSAGWVRNYSKSRIFIDGKERRYGFNRIDVGGQS